MIHIEEIKVCGESDAGAFEGAFTFKQGLQVVSADNRFGKSLAVSSIAWCLGLEPMFGLQDNDASRFPVAVREVIDLDDKVNVPVRSSRSILTLKRGDGADGASSHTSRLQARKQTMKDEAAGLQNFLFNWCGIPRAPLVTNEHRAPFLHRSKRGMD